MCGEEALLGRKRAPRGIRAGKTGPGYLETAWALANLGVFSPGKETRIPGGVRASHRRLGAHPVLAVCPEATAVARPSQAKGINVTPSEKEAPKTFP